MKYKLNCILLIDDDEPTNFLNRMTLEQVGCTRYIKVVQSGQEALDYLMHRGKYANEEESPHPDLIFLDINMPAMDGWEFLDKYRRLPEAQKVTIVMIMLTTSLNPDDQERAKTIPEISGFENKPLKADRLKEILSSYFPEKA